MAGETRILKFAEGVAVGAPLSTGVGASSFSVYASTAAFVADKGSPAAQGDAFFNSTDKKVYFYDNDQWRVIDSAKNNYTGSDPAVTNDFSEGYQIGSKWLNTTSGQLYIALDVTIGAAVWTSVGGAFVGQKQIPIGIVNGINTIYSIASTPIDGSVLVLRNGTVVPNSEYTYTHPNITFNVAPSLGTILEVWYLTDGNPSIVPINADQAVYYHTVNSSEVSAKQITLPHEPIVPVGVILDVISGTAQQYSVDFSVIGDKLSWSGYDLDGVIVSGDVLRVIYYY